VTPKIRVLVRDVPQLVRDVLSHAISNQPDMELIPAPNAPAMPIVTLAPDVVVVGTKRSDDMRDVTSTLWRWPQSQVLMITVDGHQAALYELQPQRTDLGELSPTEVVDSIRSAVRRRRHAQPPPAVDS
jgi:DNA-binding NarL/FixJ family response regulator